MGHGVDAEGHHRQRRLSLLLVRVPFRNAMGKLSGQCALQVILVCFLTKALRCAILYL
jgi:hypothetical protein